MVGMGASIRPMKDLPTSDLFDIVRQAARAYREFGTYVEQAAIKLEIELLVALHENRTRGLRGNDLIRSVRTREWQAELAHVLVACCRSNEPVPAILENAIDLLLTPIPKIAEMLGREVARRELRGEKITNVGLAAEFGKDRSYVVKERRTSAYQIARLREAILHKQFAQAE